MRRLSANWWQYLLMAIAMAIFVACSGDSSEQAKVSDQTQVIEHAMGETEVPKQPQRIVTLDGGSLESVLALDFQPVGVALGSSLSEEPDFVQKPLPEDIPTVTPGQPNLEQIVQMEPDLIVGSKSWNSHIYSELSQIAPTVLTATNNQKWQTNLKFWGRVLGKPEQAKQQLEQYRQRVKELQQQLEPVKPIEVSVARVFTDQIRLYLKDSFSGDILETLGLGRPPGQDKDEYQINGISREQFDLVDGDVMFAITMDNKAAQALEELSSDPVWSKLSVVERDRVYQVGGYWVGSNILAANEVLNDIEQHLLQESENKATVGELTQALFN